MMKRELVNMMKKKKRVKQKIGLKMMKKNPR
jgi:hypothetical protein